MSIILRLLLRLLLCASLALSIIGVTPIWAAAQTDPAELAKAVSEIEYLDALRSGLASTLKDRDTEPTLQTMKEVCRPVGIRAQQLSEANSWQVKQVAKKYRNPDHAPTNLNEQMALTRFQFNPDLTAYWHREILDDQEGTRYYRRIDVEGSCLVCHGAKSRRPTFVVDNYLDDRAYDFNVGDLRGMYATFIPDVKTALENSE